MCFAFYNNRILKVQEKLPEYIKRINPPPNIKSKPISFILNLKKYYKDKTVNIFDVKNICTWTNSCRCVNCRI